MDAYLNATAVLRIAIIGAGKMGQQIAQHLGQCGNYIVVGFWDDTLALHTPTAHGPVLGAVAAAAAAHVRGEFDQLLLGIGYNHLVFRQRIFEELSPSIPFATFTHAAAHVDPSATLAPGCFVSPGCIIDLNVSIGPNCFLYPGCVVAHDSQLVGHTMLAPAVHLAGEVVVAERCFLGIGTTISDGRHIGPDVRTGAGTVVLSDLAVPGTYVGTPARPLPAK